MSAIQPYRAAAIQAPVISITNPLQRDQVMLANWATQEALLTDRPAGTKLVVLPELSLQGTSSLPPAEQRKIAVQVPGSQLRPVQDFAKAQGVHLALSVWEDDPDWPEIFFKTGLVISPSGEVLVKRRKLQGCGQAASPFDFYTRYSEKYGDEAFFPVAKTEIGSIGLLMNEEIFYPENVRCLAMHGAEILCHLTAEDWDEKIEVMGNVKTVAASLGSAYLISADTAQAGRSAIKDWMGRSMAESGGATPGITSALLELERLRYDRIKSFPVANVNSPMWAKEYSRANAGLPLDSNARNEEERSRVYAKAMEQKVAAGLLPKSDLKY